MTLTVGDVLVSTGEEEPREQPIGHVMTSHNNKCQEKC